jgi:leader peptidase (prepilin peptidase)/N-methyltransferase
LNVVILRMPAGMSLVTPPSHDPATGRRLSWWENIPILSYVLLGGRSRHSGGWISPQYPVVEAMTGLLFVWVTWVLYGSGLRAEFLMLGLLGNEPTAAVSPTLALRASWPALMICLTLVGGLVAATVIDARLYIIPLPITWFVAGVAAVGYPLAAALGYPPDVLAFMNAAGEVESLYAAPRVGDTLTCVAIGGLVGLGVAMGGLAMGWLPRSFDAGEADEMAGEAGVADAPSGASDPAASRGSGGGDESVDAARPSAKTWSAWAWGRSS